MNRPSISPQRGSAHTEACLPFSTRGHTGEHVAQGNPLRRKQFLDEDRRWTHVSSLARSSMRLAAYAGALTNLAVQADDLRVTREDRMLLNSLLLSISELMWKQSTRTSLYTTRRRRDLTLSALGFSEQQRAQLTRDMPFEGPYLFSGQFTPRLKEELTVRQQARELAGQLRQSQPPRHRSSASLEPYPVLRLRPHGLPARCHPRSPAEASAEAADDPEREIPWAARSSPGGPGPRWLLIAYPERLGPLRGWAAACRPSSRLGGHYGRRLRAIRHQRQLQHRASRPSSRRRHPISPPHACLPA